jgi:HEAT repeat protein
MRRSAHPSRSLPPAALGMLGLAMLLLVAPAARAADESPEALVKILVGEDSTPRYDAYRKLIEKHPPEALPLIAKALPASPLIAQNYGTGIVGGYPAAQTKPIYERWIGCDAPYLRVVAGAALFRAGDSKAMAAVVEVFTRKDLEPGVLSYCFSSVYGLRDPALGKAIRAWIKPDAEPSVLGPVLYHLTTVQDAESRPLAEKLLTAPSPSTRALAAAFLVKLGDESRADVLAEALKTADFPYNTFIHMQSMLSNGARLPEVVLEALLSIVEAEPAGWYLPLIIGFLGDAGYTKAAPTLRKLLDREEAMVGKAAFEALSKIPGGLTPENVQSLLKGGDEARRVSAAEALRRADDLSGLSAVLDVLKNGKVAAAKIDAARALGGFRVRAAIEPLIDALADENLSVRANAQSSLQTLFTSLYPYRRIDIGLTGYNSSSTPAANADAISKITAWYRSAKESDW